MPLHNYMINQTINHGASFLSARAGDRQQGCRSEVRSLRPISARMMTARTTTVMATLATPGSSITPASRVPVSPNSFRSPENCLKDERLPALTAAPRVGNLSTRPHRRGCPRAALPVESAASVLCSAQAGWVVTFAGFSSLLAYHVWLNPFGNAVSSDGTPRTSWVQEVSVTILPTIINAIMPNDQITNGIRREETSQNHGWHPHIQILSASWTQFLFQ